MRLKTKSTGFDMDVMDGNRVVTSEPGITVQPVKTEDEGTEHEDSVPEDTTAPTSRATEALESLAYIQGAFDLLKSVDERYDRFLSGTFQDKIDDLKAVLHELDNCS